MMELGTSDEKWVLGQTKEALEQLLKISAKQKIK